jgi:predicted GIY-YIG superfamily endonuclease
VYRINIDGITRYVGITEDLERRRKEHIRGFKKGDKKQLYLMAQNLRNPEISIEKVISFEKSGDAKRYEAFLILGDYFGRGELWQSIPQVIKYY